MRTKAEMRRLPYELRIFAVVVCVSTAATWLIVLAARMHHLPYPYNWPFFIPDDHLHDFFDYFVRFKLLHQASFFTAPGYPFTYMAPGVLLYRFFYLFGIVHGFVVYISIIAAALIFGIAKIRSAMQEHGIRSESADAFLLLLILTSFPIAFCVERGNLEIIVAIGLALGTWAYWKERTWTAAILWGVFGSVKLYPLILLAVFWSFRQYRQFFTAVLAAIITTLLSLLYIGPDLHTASAGIWFGLNAFVKMYSLMIDRQVGFDHSLFGLLKIFSGWPRHSILPLFRVYFLIVVPAMLIIYFVRIRRLPVSNQLLILTVSSVLLPPTSFDYTLVQLYGPFIILVFVAIDAAQDGRKIYNLAFVFGLMALLFTPTNFLFFAGRELSAQLKCIMLIAVLLQSLQHPFAASTLNPNGEGKHIPGG
jgi:Glycosyltransferase family 87